jgi:hypothetical protein
MAQSRQIDVAAGSRLTDEGRQIKQPLIDHIQAIDEGAVANRYF